MRYLLCDDCGEYYYLEPDESPDEFENECDCGGNLMFIDFGNDNNLHERNSIRGKFEDNAEIFNEGIIIKRKNIRGRPHVIRFDEIEDIYFEDQSSKTGVVTIKTNKIRLEIKKIKIAEGYSFVATIRKLMNSKPTIEPLQITTDTIPIYAGNINKPYIELRKISVRADSSLLSRTATMDDVNARLREEAVKLGANAIINAKYSRSRLTSWRGAKGSGIAILLESDEKKCPFCAESIKKEAIKCKHCGSDLTQ